MSDTAITGTAMKLKSLVNTVAIKSKAVFKVSFSNNEKSAALTETALSLQYYFFRFLERFFCFGSK